MSEQYYTLSIWNIPTFRHHLLRCNLSSQSGLVSVTALSTHEDPAGFCTDTVALATFVATSLTWEHGLVFSESYQYVVLIRIIHGTSSDLCRADCDCMTLGKEKKKGWPGALSESTPMGTPVH
jgi:hypothetical protein